MRDNMKSCFAISISLIVTLACGCADRPNHEEREEKSCVIILCRNHVTNGMVQAEISEIWRDESDGAFTNNVSDMLETHAPAESPSCCGEASVLFFGWLGTDLYHHATLFVHNGTVYGNIPVTRLKALIQTTHYSGRQLEIPSKTDGHTPEL